MEEKEMSRVYIKVDERGRIIRCCDYFMGDTRTEWILVDENDGEKYNRCQNGYFSDGLYTEDGICRYKWTGTEAGLRTDAELEADRAEREQAKYLTCHTTELK